MSEDLDRDAPADLAAELSLRLLSPAEEAGARARAASDPAFAAEVEAWDARLAGMIDEVAPVDAPPGAWAAILRRLPANDDGRTAFWRRWAVGATGLLAASLVAVAVLSAQLAGRPATVEAPAPQPIRVATLRLETGQSALILAYDPATGALFASPTEAMAGDERVPHLWLVGADGGVTLVGAVDGEAVSRMAMPTTLGSAAGGAVAVAVSMEAPGHTPDLHRPDGPVVASGELERL
ncbi:anti-sigma factor domain-containing protein [Brevundimonas balnearis]|uniref:Anti-sigma factor domain-containing protein n=1 Tax=Brevundimonas balnearis TaxID=1572858 RepID=A0ABV6R4P1_9CAUL